MIRAMLNRTDLERLMYIEALLLANGSVSRADLCRRFGFSVRSATRVLKIYMQHFPDQMEMRFAGYESDKPAYASLKSMSPRLFENVRQARDFLDYSNAIETALERASSLYPG
jgi:predicted DNA-binding transcriptional regulator YafY